MAKDSKEDKKSFPIKKILIIVLGVILALALGLAASLKLLVLDRLEDIVHSGLKDNFNIECNIGKIDLDWIGLLKLRPSVSLKKIAVKNYPGYREPHSLTADKISLQLSLRQILQQNIVIKEVLIKKPQLFLERNGAGITNLEKRIENLNAAIADLEKKYGSNSSSQKKRKPAAANAASSKNSNQAPEQPNVVVEKLQLVDGRLEFHDYFSSSPNYAKLDPTIYKISKTNLELANFGEGETCDFKLGLRFFDKNRSKLDFNGSAGPIGEKSLELNGKLNANLFVKDIPQSIRKQYFGNIVLEPDDNDELRISSRLSGDLMKTIFNDGLLSLTNLELGKNKKKKINISGEVPVKFAISKLLQVPTISIDMPGSLVKLGSGELKSSSKANIYNGYIKASSQGSLSGVDINQLLSSLTPEEDKVYGNLETSFLFNLEGRDSDQMVENLTGYGKLKIDDAQLDYLNVIESVTNKLKFLTNRNFKNAKVFKDITSDFKVERNKFYTPNLAANGKLALIQGDGFFNFKKGKLSYDMQLVPQGELRDLISGSKKSQTIVPNGVIPFKVSGTSEKPKVSVEVGQLIKEAGYNLLMDTLFKGKGGGSAGASSSSAGTASPGAAVGADSSRTNSSQSQEVNPLNLLIDQLR